MRPHTTHPYYGRYGGASEVTGPALPREMHQHAGPAMGCRDSAHGSGAPQTGTLGGQHINPSLAADFQSLSASQRRVIESGGEGRDTVGCGH